MSVIPPRFLDEIRNRLSLSDVIGRRVKVTRAGREFKACCPFHNEKSPSFTINDDKQFYHCFGCGAHGDVIGFVMQYSNLSFMEALEQLAAEAGLVVPKPDPKALEKAEKSQGLHDLMDLACQWFQARLMDPAHADVLGYLEGRGLGAEARAQFRLGYAPADGQALRVAMKQAGYTEDQMMESGLIKASAKGGQAYSFFRDRVMFPVCDKRGRVVAFGGRILPAHLRPQSDEGFKPPKYINSADTPLFDKGRLLYGESLARQSARTGHTLIVTEGYMDVIACHMAGFKGAVAPMGTAMTEDQILSLWSMMGDSEKMPILCFDGDNAGRRAASRACERILPLLKPGQGVRFAFLPEGEDPDSLLRSAGRSGLQSVLQGSLSLFDFIWAAHTAGRDFETPEARAGLSRALSQDIAVIADQNVQKHYKALLNHRISEAFFKPAFSRKDTGGPPSKGLAKQDPSRGLKLRSPVKPAPEKALLATLLNYPALYEALEEEFGRFPLPHARLGNLRGRLIGLLEEGGSAPLESKALTHMLFSEGFSQELRDILCESVYVHYSFCRPAEGNPVEEAEILTKWRILRDGILGPLHERDKRRDWERAFENANEEDENKLRQRVQAHASTES